MFQIGPFRLNSQLVLVLRNLRTRWVRTVLTTLGIIVGVAAMTAVNAANESTLSSIGRFFDETSGRTDLSIESAAAGESFSEEVMSLVSRFPAVITAAPGVMGVTLPADEAGSYDPRFGAGGVLLPGTNFWLMGRDPAADMGIHEYELVEGRLLRADETSHNLLLVDEYAAEKEVNVGDDFAIVTAGGGIAKLRVVGLIAKAGIGMANEGVLGIAPLNVVQDLFGLAGQLNQIDLVLDPDIAADGNALEAARWQIEQMLDDSLAVKLPAARGQLVVDSLQSYRQGLDFFSVVTLFVGSFLIYNAFAMTVVERTREIGMLRAIGSTSSQILRMVLAEAMMLGAAGSLIGAGAGILLARFLVISVSGFSGQRIELITAAPESIIQSIVIGILVTLASAVIPSWQASRISPMQALHAQGSVDEGRWLVTGLRYGPLTLIASYLIFYHVPMRADIVFQVGSSTIFVMMLGATLCIPIFAGFIERAIRPFIIFVFGNEGRLGSGNVNRAKGRTTLTVAALMVGISMVVGINGLTQSFEADIQAWVDTALGGDLFVRSPLKMKVDVESRLRSLPEVQSVTRTRYVASQLTQPSGKVENAVFVAIDPGSYLSVSGLRIQDGPAAAEVMNQLAAGNAVLVGADAAGKFGIDVGDDVILQTRRGKLPFRVAAIVIDFSGGETTTITGSWRDLRRYFGINDVSTYFVRLAPGASLTQAADQIENGLGRGRDLAVESKQEFEQKVRELSAQAFSLFDVLGLIGLVVAALGVINTMLMNVVERTRELGGLRSLGMERRQVQRMILAEAAAMGFIGAIFGVTFGAVLSDVFVIGLESMGGFVLVGQLPVTAMIGSFFMTFAVAILSAWYPAVRASRVNIIAAIKNE